MTDVFTRQKKEILTGLDQSKKGSFDSHIHDLIVHINSLENFVTTSSCSGRIIVFSEGESKKKGCKWLLTSHEEVSAVDVIESVKSANGNEKIISFKYESFILHVQGRTQDDAQNMLKIALDCGYRNSGMVIGKKKKFMLAVRSTHGLEVPLQFTDSVAVSDEYVKHLVSLANEKLRENFIRIEKFFGEIKKTFPGSSS